MKQATRAKVYPPRGSAVAHLVLISPVQTPFHLLTCLVAAFVFDGCATAPKPREVQFSGVTWQDVREIEFLVAGRGDILKPVISVHRVSTIPAGNPLNGKIQVVAGRDERVGDTFDTFTVAKRHGRWAVTSTVERDSLIISTY
jgi:hypothetical protein